MHNLLKGFTCWRLHPRFLKYRGDNFDMLLSCYCLKNLSNTCFFYISHETTVSQTAGLKQQGSWEKGATMKKLRLGHLKEGDKTKN